MNPLRRCGTSLATLLVGATLGATTGPAPALAGASGAVPAAITPATPTAATPAGARLMQFLADADEQDLELNPQAALQRGDLRHADQFGDLISDDYYRSAETTLRQQLQQFREIQRQQLNVTERVAYDVFRYQADYALRLYTSRILRSAQQLPIDHLIGQHIVFAQFSSGSAGAPYKTLADYENGLKRIDGFVIYLDRAIVRMQEGLRDGRVQPREITRKVIAQLDEALALAPEASPFYGPILVLPANFSADEQQRLQSAYREAIAKRIQPAFLRLRNFMQHDYLPAGRGASAPGMATMPGGKRLYEYQLEGHTTLRMPADQIHRLGLAEVGRIRGEMHHLLRRLEFSGSLNAFFDHLKSDQRFKFMSKAALLDAYKTIGQGVDRAWPALFASVPRATLRFATVPPEQESSASGAYYIVGTPDDSRPGTFYVNTGELASRTSPRMTALYLHEAVPGHHFQASLAQENAALPPLLRFGWNAGFGEGWALYAEWLGHEMGLYDDPIQHFGRLEMEIFRAARLVVDTGLHARRWSRERAIRYLLANTSLDRGSIEQEVDRYIVWPGQATAYKLGELKIRALRRHAERSLGARFDIREFHHQVLATGALPLHVLEMKINDWIRAQR